MALNSTSSAPHTVRLPGLDLCGQSVRRPLLRQGTRTGNEASHKCRDLGRTTRPTGASPISNPDADTELAIAAGLRPNCRIASNLARTLQ